MTPDEYCQEKTAASGSSFYYSFLFLDPDRRRAITALYAFCREVDDVVDECSEPSVARMKLEWWRQEVERLFDGQPQHPVAQALAPWLERFDLPREHFHEVIDGMEMDLDIHDYPDFRTLSLYCYRVASVVGLMAAEIFGYQSRQTRQYANDLGMAFQLTNILRDVHEDAQRGRIYLPAEDREAHGVSRQDLLMGRETEDMRSLFAFEADRARDYYRRALEGLPEEDRYAQRSGVIMAAIYQRLLDRMDADGYHAMTRRYRLPAWRKLWVAWRTARREAKRARKAGQ
ncbi:farnesyl-diphosphate farnesyltransferase [Thiohalospira halophila DSM 15071]|uniref:Farnesyl-diphosphate farnesyltransferase n=1 Tax=Thiohalospira halophila DSM 15071 TaxID=1123397 RepID=A0A1I1NFQ6_9GAMM|nr:presqualene diphosphate synthase HpnD [Thiohalospira halophila]SFC94298.1 farnesyl-diphosphate farnesyltransferase [Thiohalospira halophila DSM 15071]